MLAPQQSAGAIATSVHDVMKKRSSKLEETQNQLDRASRTELDKIKSNKSLKTIKSSSATLIRSVHSVNKSGIRLPPIHGTGSGDATKKSLSGKSSIQSKEDSLESNPREHPPGAYLRTLPKLKSLHARLALKRKNRYQEADFIRLGPPVIDSDNVECTPIALWFRADPFLDLDSLLDRTADEVVHMVPIFPRSISAQIRFQKSRGKALSFDSGLTVLEEEAWHEGFELFKPFKYAFNLPKMLPDPGYEILEEKASTSNPYQRTKVSTKSIISFQLKETSTVFLFTFPGALKLESDVDYEATKQRNERYKLMVQRHFESDTYNDDYVQTVKKYYKTKATDYRVVMCADVGVQAKSYEIADEFTTLAEEDAKRAQRLKDEAGLEALIAQGKKNMEEKEWDQGGSSSDESDEIAEGEFVSRINWDLYKDDEVESEKEDKDSEGSVYSLSSDEDIFDTEVDLETIYEREKIKAEKIRPVRLPDIHDTVMLVLRSLDMNNSQGRQELTRGYPDVKRQNRERKREMKKIQYPLYESKTAEQKAIWESIPTLVKCWSFEWNEARGLEVTDVAVHPKFGNVVAACYGSCKWEDRYNEKGLLVIWNGKNTHQPEKFKRLRAPATCLAFSTQNPNHMAVGFIDGSIMVFDIADHIECLTSTVYQEDRHLGPVWQLVWHVQVISDEPLFVYEFLLSVGDEGIVKRWMSRKAFEATTILFMRRSPLMVPNRPEKRAECLMSDLRTGYCICFFPGDEKYYLLGTEEGLIHKCSTGYGTEFVSTYLGHMGPVYKILFSPFHNEIFISCGGDWTIKIWKVDNIYPLHNMQTGHSTIFDVVCHTKVSTIFIAAAEQHLEVWDLTLNTLEPVVHFKTSKGAGMRKVVYSEEMKAILIGCTDGSISVCSLQNFPETSHDRKHQIDQLFEGIIPGYKRRSHDSALEAEKEIEEAELGSSGVEEVTEVVEKGKEKGKKAKPHKPTSDLLFSTAQTNIVSGSRDDLRFRYSPSSSDYDEDFLPPEEAPVNPAIKAIEALDKDKDDKEEEEAEVATVTSSLLEKYRAAEVIREKQKERRSQLRREEIEKASTYIDWTFWLSEKVSGSELTYEEDVENYEFHSESDVVKK